MRRALKAALRAWLFDHSLRLMEGAPLLLGETLDAQVRPIAVRQPRVIAEVLRLIESVLPWPRVAILCGVHASPVSLGAAAPADAQRMLAVLPKRLVCGHKNTLALPLASDLPLPIRGIGGAAIDSIRASNLPLPMRGIGGAASVSVC